MWARSLGEEVMALGDGQMLPSREESPYIISIFPSHLFPLLFVPSALFAFVICSCVIKFTLLMVKGETGECE